MLIRADLLAGTKKIKIKNWEKEEQTTCALGPTGASALDKKKSAPKKR